MNKAKEYLYFVVFMFTSLTQISYSITNDLNYSFESWLINKKHIQFVKYEDTFILVSKKCDIIKNLDSLHTSNCVALKKLASISLKSLKSNSLKGGKNPGAVLCSQVLNAKVVYGLTKFKDERTFCLFSDDSYISTEALTIYGTNQ